MKKTLLLIIACILCSTLLPGLCEELDLKTRDTSELIRYMTDIQKELYSRKIFDDVLWPGYYIVGEDLEPGVYVVSLMEQIQGTDGFPEIMAIKNVRNTQFIHFEEPNIEPKLNLLDGTKLNLFNGIFSFNRIS